MNVSDIMNQLAGVLTSQSQAAAAIAHDATNATMQYNAGQLTLSEYQEIIGDLNTERVINLEAAALVEKEVLNKVFNQISNALTIITSIPGL